MNEETNVKQIIEMISIYQDTNIKNLNSVELNLIVKDLNTKKEEIDDELCKLYESGANPVDDSYIINEMENAITAIDDLLSDISMLCNIKQPEKKKEPQRIEKEEIIEETKMKEELSTEEILEKKEDNKKVFAVLEIEKQTEEQPKVEELPKVENNVDKIFKEVKYESSDTHKDFKDEVLKSNEQEYIEQTEEVLEEKIEKPKIIKKEKIVFEKETKNPNNTILDILNGNLTNNDYKLIAQGIVENRKPSIENAISKGNDTVQVVIGKIAEALNQNRE